MYLGPDPDSDSEGELSLVTLPDGRMACDRHLRIVCHRCCVDFSFMDANDEDIEDDEDDEDSEDGEDEEDGEEELPNLHHTNYGTPEQPNFGETLYRRNMPMLLPTTEHVFPTKFTPRYPDSAPGSLFQGRVINTDPILTPRFFHRQEPDTYLIYTDGACLNNGQANPRAGWAFVYGPQPQETTAPGSYSGARSPPGGGAALAASRFRTVSGRLENKGPTGLDAPQTSNRAELRAALAVLQFRFWPGECIKTLVIATDSTYLVDAATSWARGWVRNGWTTRQGGDVKNKDLWEALLARTKEFAKFGMKVELWKIPRESNTVADAIAKEAAEEADIANYRDVFGVLC